MVRFLSINFSHGFLKFLLGFSKVPVFFVSFCTWDVECKNKSGTSNSRDSWNHIKITQKIPEQHTGKAGHQGATEKSLTGHCARTVGSADVKVQNIQRG